ncbi:MAG: SDR family NAD(P)-dependent oxidoreductase [Thermodesulfobacteriota bacterium]
MLLHGKVALVTGAARGIGQAILLALAQNGAEVIVNDLLEKEGQETVRAAQGLGVRAFFAKADVSKELEVKEMFSVVYEHFGQVDILVNNAGVGSPLMVEDMPYEIWQKVIDTNLNAAFLCCKQVIPRMQERRYGRIINISSIAAKKISYHGSAAYTAAKAGLLGFTRHLAYELAPYGITVNAICPGGTLTQRIRERVTPQEIEEEIKRFPMGRWGRPEDQAKAVLFLVSDQAEFITGQAIDVDGGELLAWINFETYRRWRKRFVIQEQNKRIN